MARPLAQKNKCLEHNLLKRSLGLPYKFSWKEDKFTRPFHSDNGELILEKRDVLVPYYGLPNEWDIEVTNYSSTDSTITNDILEPMQDRIDSILLIDASEEGAVNDTKEYVFKESVSNTNSDRLSSLHFNSTSIKPRMPVYPPCFPKMIKNQVLRPKALHCPLTIDKVFCSEWITDDEVIFGTKCHKLLRYNTRMDCFTKVMEPTLSDGTINTLGIRCMKCNPSSTLLATVDFSGCNVALYLLPSMIPFMCVTESIENNRIFDLCWLSNCKLAVARREGLITIWNFQSLFVCEHLEQSSSTSLCMNVEIQSQDPLFDFSRREETDPECYNEGMFDVLSEDFREVSFCVRDRVRALAFNGEQTLFVLNSGGSVCSFDTVTFKSNWSMAIPGGIDNTCLAYSENLKLLAIGSNVCVLFVEDSGGVPHLSQVELPTADSMYVRSLAFQDQTLSVGTGAGQLFFIDLSEFWSGKISYYRTRYLFPINNQNDAHKLEGYVDPRRDFLSYSRSLKDGNLVDSKFDDFSIRQFSRLQTFDRPLLKTFYEVVQSLQESGHSKNVKRKVEKYYENLDKLCKEDIDSKYVEEYCRRDLTNFEIKTLISAQEDRGDLLPEDSLAVYAQSYNPNTGQLFVAGGPLSIMNEGAFCCLFR